MAISVNVEEVVTEDAVPKTAPNKISAKATKTLLTFKFKATATSVIVALRTRLSPSNRNTGKLLYSRGMVCGTGDRCGTKWATSLSMPSGTAVTGEIQESQVGEADGEYEVKTFAVSAADGWST